MMQAFALRFARRAQCALLISVLAGAGNAVGSQEGILGFRETAVVVAENARTAELTVTRTCAVHGASSGRCNGHISVAYTTESVRSVQAPGTVVVTEGSRNVTTAVDLRGVLRPGDAIRIGAQELRVDSTRPVLQTGFTLERPFLGDGNPAFVHRINNRVPGTCIATAGSPIVATSHDLRFMAARNELLRVGTFTATISDTGVFSATQVALDAPLPSAGAFPCYAQHRYSGITDPTGVDVVVVDFTVGSTTLTVKKKGLGGISATDIVQRGDIVKLGTRTYVADDVQAAQIVVRRPVVDGDVEKGSEGIVAFFRRAGSALPGSCTIVAGNGTAVCDHEVRALLSVGDYVRFDSFTTRVADLPAANEIVFEEPCAVAALCGAGDRAVFGDHSYTPLRGSFNVEDGSRVVDTLLDATQQVQRGDLLKIGPNNYVVAHDGEYGARRLTLAKPFEGRNRTSAALFLVRPSAGGTAQAGFDYVPSIGRLFFPRGVTERRFLVHLLDNDVDEPGLTIVAQLTDARYEDPADLSLGADLGCTATVTNAANRLDVDSDCPDLTTMVYVGDAVSVDGEHFAVEVVAADHLLLNATASAALKGVLFKLFPSIRSSEGTCTVEIADDAEKPMGLLPGTFDVDANTSLVTFTTAELCGLIIKGDSLQCGGTDVGTVLTCGSAAQVITVSPSPTIASVVAATCMVKAAADSSGTIQFASSTFEQVERPAAGGSTTSLAIVELERVGGVAGDVAVTLETAHPLGSSLLGGTSTEEAVGSWGGGDVYFSSLVAAARGSPHVVAPVDALPLSDFLTQGDVVGLEGYVFSVNAVNATVLTLGDPEDSASEVAFQAASYARAPLRLLTRWTGQYAFASEGGAPALLFSGADLRGRVQRGGFVKVGDIGVRLSPTAHIDDVSPVGELDGAVVRNGSALLVTRDARAGARQMFECYADGGYLSVRCGDEVSRSVGALSTVGQFEQALLDMGHIVAVGIQGAAPTAQLCGPDAVSRTVLQLHIARSSFNDRVCDLVAARDHLELGGKRGGGVARFTTHLGLLRGDYIGTAGGVHRVDSAAPFGESSVPISGTVFEDTTVDAGRVSRVQRVPVASWSSPGNATAYREKLFLFQGASWLRATGAVVTGAAFLTTSADLREGFRQVLRCRAASGHMQLEVAGAYTPPIRFDAPASDLEAALVALPHVLSAAVTLAGGGGASTVCAPAGASPVDATIQLTMVDSRVELGGRLIVHTRTLAGGAPTVAQIALVPGLVRGDALLVNGIVVSVSMDDRTTMNATHVPLARPWQGRNAVSTPLFVFKASDSFLGPDFVSLPDTTTVVFPHGVARVAVPISLAADGLVEDEERVSLAISRPRRACAETNCRVETRLYCAALPTSGRLVLLRGGSAVVLNASDAEAAVRSAVVAAFPQVQVAWTATESTLCAASPSHFIMLVEEPSAGGPRPAPFSVNASELAGHAFAQRNLPLHDGSGGRAPPSLGTARATLTIQDPGDAICGTFRIADAGTPLSLADKQPLAFAPHVVVERVGGSDSPAAVEIAVQSGSALCTGSWDDAEVDADCLVVASTFYFDRGVQRLPIPVQALGDVDVESVESFAVSILSASGRNCSVDPMANTRSITITDAAASSTDAVTWTSHAFNATEGCGVASVILRRPSAYGHVNATVSMSSPSAGTARAVLLTSVASFLPGQLTTEVLVRVLDDLLWNGAQALEVRAGAPYTCSFTPCLTGTASATLFIVDDDDASSLAGSSAGLIRFAHSVVSAREDAVDAVVTLTRLGGANGTATVTLTSKDGSATAGVHYVALAASPVAFGHGQRMALATVGIVDNFAFEGESKGFEIAIDGATGAGTTAAVHIVDDGDVPGAVEFAPIGGAAVFRVSEHVEFVALTLTRVGGASGSVSVTVQTRGVSASPGHPSFPATDYAGIYEGGLMPGGLDEASQSAIRVEFDEGVTALPFFFRVLDDACFEGDELVGVTLSNYTVLAGSLPADCPEGTCQGIATSGSVNLTITEDGQDRAGQPSWMVLHSGPAVPVVTHNVACSAVDTSTVFTLDVSFRGGSFSSPNLTCAPGTGAAHIESALLRTGIARRIAVTSAAPGQWRVSFDDASLSGVQGAQLAIGATVLAGQQNVTVSKVVAVNASFVRGATLPSLVAEIRDACDEIATLEANVTLEASLWVQHGNPCLAGTTARAAEVQEVTLYPLASLVVDSVSVAKGSRLIWIKSGGIRPPLLTAGTVLYLGAYERIGIGTAVGGGRTVTIADATAVDRVARGAEILLEGSSYVVYNAYVDGSATAIVLTAEFDAPYGEAAAVDVVVTPYPVTLVRSSYQLRPRACLVGNRNLAPLAGELDVPLGVLEGAKVEISFMEFTLDATTPVEQVVQGVTQGAHVRLTTAHGGDTEAHQSVFLLEDKDGRFAFEISEPYEGPQHFVDVPTRDASAFAALPVVSAEQGSAELLMTEDLRSFGLQAGSRLSIKGNPYEIGSFGGSTGIDLSGARARGVVEKLQPHVFTPNWQLDRDRGSLPALVVGDLLAVGNSTARYLVRILPRTDTVLSTSATISGTTVTADALSSLVVGDKISFPTNSAGYSDSYRDTFKVSALGNSQTVTLEDASGLVAPWTRHLVVHSFDFDVVLVGTGTLSSGVVTVTGLPTGKVVAEDFVAVVPIGGDETDPQFHYKVASVSSSGQVTLTYTPSLVSNGATVTLYIVVFKVTLDRSYQGTSAEDADLQRVSRSVFLTAPYQGPTQARIQPFDSGGLDSSKTFALSIGSTTVSGLNASASRLEVQQAFRLASTEVSVRRSFTNGGWKWQLSYEGRPRNVDPLRLCGKGLCNSTGQIGVSGFIVRMATVRQGSETPVPDVTGNVKLPVEGSSCGTLSGTLIKRIDAGSLPRVTFSDLAVEGSQAGYSLRVYALVDGLPSRTVNASSPPFFAASTGSFSVTSDSLGSIRLSEEPGFAVTGRPLGRPPVVQLRDAVVGGNPAFSAAANVTVSIRANHAGSNVGGIGTLGNAGKTAVSGVTCARGFANCSLGDETDAVNLPQYSVAVIDGKPYQIGSPNYASFGSSGYLEDSIIEVRVGFKATSTETTAIGAFKLDVTAGGSTETTEWIESNAAALAEEAQSCMTPSMEERLEALPNIQDVTVAVVEELVTTTNATTGVTENERSTVWTITFHSPRIVNAIVASEEKVKLCESAAVSPDATQTAPVGGDKLSVKASGTFDASQGILTVNGITLIGAWTNSILTTADTWTGTLFSADDLAGATLVACSSGASQLITLPAVSVAVLTEGKTTFLIDRPFESPSGTYVAHVETAESLTKPTVGGSAVFDDLVVFAPAAAAARPRYRLDFTSTSGHTVTSAAFDVKTGILSPSPATPSVGYPDSLSVDPTSLPSLRVGQSAQVTFDLSGRGANFRVAPSLRPLIPEDFAGRGLLSPVQGAFTALSQANPQTLAVTASMALTAQSGALQLGNSMTIRAFWDEDLELAWSITCLRSDPAFVVREEASGDESGSLDPGSVTAAELEAALAGLGAVVSVRVRVPLRLAGTEDFVCRADSAEPPAYIWAHRLQAGSNPLSSTVPQFGAYSGGAKLSHVQPLFVDATVGLLDQSAIGAASFGFTTVPTDMQAGLQVAPALTATRVDTSTSFAGALVNDDALLEVYGQLEAQPLCGLVRDKTGDVITFTEPVEGRLWPNMLLEIDSVPYRVLSVAGATAQVDESAGSHRLAVAYHYNDPVAGLVSGTKTRPASVAQGAKFDDIVVGIPSAEVFFRATPVSQSKSFRVSVSMNILADTSAPIQGSFRLLVTARGVGILTPKIAARATATDVYTVLTVLPHLDAALVNVTRALPDLEFDGALLAAVGVFDYDITFQSTTDVTIAVVGSTMTSITSAVRVSSEDVTTPSPGALSVAPSPALAVAAPFVAEIIISASPQVAMADSPPVPAVQVAMVDPSGAPAPGDAGSSFPIRAVASGTTASIRCTADGGSVRLNLTVGQLWAQTADLDVSTPLRASAGVSLESVLEDLWVDIGEGTVDASDPQLVKGAPGPGFGSVLSVGDEVRLGSDCTAGARFEVVAYTQADRPGVNFRIGNAAPVAAHRVCLHLASDVRIQSSGGQATLCAPYRSAAVEVTVVSAFRRAFGGVAVSLAPGPDLTGSGGSLQRLTCTASASAADVQLVLSYRGGASRPLHGGWSGSAGLQAVEAALAEAGTVVGVSASWCSGSCTALCGGCCISVAFKDAITEALSSSAGESFRGDSTAALEPLNALVVVGSAAVAVTGSPTLVSLRRETMLGGATEATTSGTTATFHETRVVSPVPDAQLRAFADPVPSFAFTIVCRASSGKFKLHLGTEDAVVVGARDDAAAIQSAWSASSIGGRAPAVFTIHPPSARACTATGLSQIIMNITSYGGQAGGRVVLEAMLPTVEAFSDDEDPLSGCNSTLVSGCTATTAAGSDAAPATSGCGGAIGPGDLVQIDGTPAVVKTINASHGITFATRFTGPGGASQQVYLSWTPSIRLSVHKRWATTPSFPVSPGVPSSLPLPTLATTAAGQARVALASSIPHNLRARDLVRIDGALHVVTAIASPTEFDVDPAAYRTTSEAAVQCTSADPALPGAVEVRVVQPPGMAAIEGVVVLAVGGGGRTLALSADPAEALQAGEMLAVAFGDGRYASFLVAAVGTRSVTATRRLPSDAQRRFGGRRLFRAAGGAALRPTPVITFADSAMVPSGSDIAVAEVFDDHVVQTMQCTATGGSFRLRLGEVVTGEVAFNAGAGDLQAGLEALPTVGAGNVTVSLLSSRGRGPSSATTLCNATAGAFIVVEFLAFNGSETRYDGADRHTSGLGSAPPVPPLLPLEWTLEGGGLQRLASPEGEAGLVGQTRVPLVDGVAVFAGLALRRPGIGQQLRFRLAVSGAPVVALALSPRLVATISPDSGVRGVRVVSPSGRFMSRDATRGVDLDLQLVTAGGDPVDGATTSVVLEVEDEAGNRTATSLGADVPVAAVDGVVHLANISIPTTGSSRSVRLHVYEWNVAASQRGLVLSAGEPVLFALSARPARLSAVSTPGSIVLSGEFSVAVGDTNVTARIGGTQARPPARVLEEIAAGDAVRIGGVVHAVDPLRELNSGAVPLSRPHNGTAVTLGTMERVPTAGQPLPGVASFELLDDEDVRVAWDSATTVWVGLGWSAACPTNEIWSPDIVDPAMDGRVQLVRCRYDDSLASWAFSLSMPGEALTAVVTPLTREADLAAALRQWSFVSAVRVSFSGADAGCANSTAAEPATIVVEFTDVDEAELVDGIVPKMGTRTDRVHKIACSDVTGSLALTVQGQLTANFSGSAAPHDVAALVAGLPHVDDAEIVAAQGAAALCATPPPETYLHVRGVRGGGPSRVAMGPSRSGETLSVTPVALDPPRPLSQWTTTEPPVPLSLLHVSVARRAVTVNGVARVRDLRVKDACPEVRLAVWSDATPLTAAAFSAPFQVWPGSVRRLAFKVTPELAIAGTHLVQQPQVNAVDVTGNVARDIPFTVTARLAVHASQDAFTSAVPTTSAASLAGTASVATASGMAPFTDLGIDMPALQAQLEFTSDPALPGRRGAPYTWKLLSPPFPVAGPPRRLRVSRPWTTRFWYPRNGGNTTLSESIDLAVEVTDMAGVRAALSSGLDPSLSQLTATLLSDPYCPRTCTLLEGGAVAAVVAGRATFTLRVAALPVGHAGLRPEVQWVRVVRTSPGGALSGSFRLAATHGGERYLTKLIRCDASAKDVKDAVEEIPLPWAPVDVVAGQFIPLGSGAATAEWYLTFPTRVGDVPQLTATTVELTAGGSPSGATVVTGTAAEGSGFRIRLRGSYGGHPLVADTAAFGIEHG